MKRILLSLVLASSLAGCYGSYSAGHAVHRWNGQVSSDKLVRSAVHLGLYIVPVYELAWLGDFWVFNTIEFLTGTPVFK